MVVKNLVGPSLLGSDFLNLYQANIDFINKKMTLLGSKGPVILKFDKETKNLDNNRQLTKSISNDNLMVTEDKTSEISDLGLIQNLLLVAKNSHKLNEVSDDGF